MNYDRGRIQDYFFGCSINVADRILFIRRADRLDEYSHYLLDTLHFGHVWKGLTGLYRGETVTIIAGGIGPSQIGDAVYALDKPEAVCVFSGTCGGIDTDIQIGDYFLAEQAICGDGYGILFGHQPFSVVSSDKSAISQLKQAFNLLKIPTKAGTVFSTSSVVKETEPDFWNLIDPACGTIEMECAAFYVAALHSAKSAAAYFWVTDLPNLGKSFFDTLSVEEMAVKQERYNTMVEIDLHILSSI